MKLVVIIGNPTPPLIYFTNMINDNHKIDLLIIEKPKQINQQKTLNSTLKASKSSFALNFTEKVLESILYKIKQFKKHKENIDKNLKYYKNCEKWFADLFSSVDQSIPFLEVDNINSSESQIAIAKINPEIILDHGSSLVKPGILKLAKLALNLHWGLSPYYRGQNCTTQALINWDILNIGVTVHKLAVQIDGGDILGQARATITEEDDVKSIPLQLTALGTQIIIKALNKFKEGEELIFKAQNYSEGFLVRGLYWNSHINAFAAQLDKEQIRQMLDKPSRGKLPIIQLE